MSATVQRRAAHVIGISAFYQHHTFHAYKVEVVDNAEPGRGIDDFSISVSNGYAAGFEYGDGPIAGGNIQLHTPNPSNTPPSEFTCSQE